MSASKLITNYSRMSGHHLEMLIDFKEGKEFAFDFFYQKYKIKLYSNILRLVKSPEIASDILQEVFIAAWTNREKVNTDLPLENLLYRIARNKVYDFFRKAARDRNLEESLLVNSAFLYLNDKDADHQSDRFLLIKKEIENLPPKCKEVFKLIKLEGMSYNEVSELLGISSATVNNHIVKATTILKTKFSLLEISLCFLFFKFL
jgi:RNA polymerase sigma-70 factor (family 1)